MRREWELRIFRVEPGKKGLALKDRWRRAWDMLAAPFRWLFLRLPRGFTIPLLAFIVPYLLFAFPLFVNVLIPLLFRYVADMTISLYWAADSIDSGWLHKMAVSTVLSVILAGAVISPIVLSILTLGFALSGILVGYWLAGKIYLRYRSMRGKTIEAPTPVLPASDEADEADEADDTNPLARYKKIGIVLSGGGAKGAYQAGAMKAIYEFLEDNKAHHKVQMIAATSIGSWNALFWLAGLIKENAEGYSPIKRWWEQVNVQSLILPVTYKPTRQNFLLSNDPWKETFDAFFFKEKRKHRTDIPRKDREDIPTEAGKQLLYHITNCEAKDAIKFYFTHSNIEKARLDFTTNRNDWSNVSANQPTERPRSVMSPDRYRIAEDLEDIKTGVFCSMDIPPLFPYSEIGKYYVEDGGVVDNLPIRFGTEIEECDLLFILPLNASFDKEVNLQSLIKRLARVTEIRQGVLERNAFKMIYLYNELASLRNIKDELEAQLAANSQQAKQPDGELTPKKITEKKIANRASCRTHQVVHVFSICPAPALKLCTTEFWKTKEAGEAFEFMYEVTRNELKQRFYKMANSKQIRVALVCHLEDGCANLEMAGADDATAESLSPDDDLTDKPISKCVGKVRYNVTYFKDF